MTKIKKSLLALPLLIALLFTSFMLIGCGKKAEFSLSQDLLSKANTVVNNLVANVFDAETLKGDKDSAGKEKYNYTVDEIKAVIPSAEFYVQVGTFKNIKNLEKISIGNYTFKAGEDVKVSIGNSNFIVDDAFVVEGDKLLVSANIIAFESFSANKIKLNDAEFDFNIQDPAKNISVTNIKFNSGKNTVVKSTTQEDTYNLSIVNGTNPLLIDYEGKQNTDVVFTRKVVDGVLTGYGITALDTVNGEKFFMFYPMGWAANETSYNQEREAKNGKTLEYEFYVANKGVAKVNFVYDIAAYSAENN